MIQPAFPKQITTRARGRYRSSARAFRPMPQKPRKCRVTGIAVHGRSLSSVLPYRLANPNYTRMRVWEAVLVQPVLRAFCFCR